MPVNNALTPEGQNSLGAAFGYFPQLRRNRTVQDPRLAAEMPLQFLRGRAAATLGAPSDILNFLRSPLPMEVAGDVDYAQQAQVPYGSQELLRTLPLPPKGAAQAAAANVGAVVPLTPTEALAAARAARQAALASGRTLGPTAERMAADYLQRQGLMPGVLPTEGRSGIKSIDDVLAKYPDVKIDASVNKNDLNLSRIVVPKEMRNQGVGTRVMNDLSEYADSIGKRITLTPSSDFGGNVGKLKGFYKELGFVENKGRNKDFSTREAMYREPKPLEQAPAFQYPQEEALRLAQQRATLPVEQYGLGLPAGNTAQQRAAAMGFDVDAYHGTKSTNIEKFMPEGGLPEGEKTLEWYKNRQAQNEPVGYMSFRSGSFFSPKPEYAGHYTGEGTGAMYPVKLRMDNPLNLLPNNAGRYGVTNTPNPSKTIDAMVLQDSMDKSINEISIIDPDQIRSRFAAFDPFRRNAAIAAATGAIAPDLLAAQAEQDAYSRNELRKFKRQSQR